MTNLKRILLNTIAQRLRNWADALFEKLSQDDRQQIAAPEASRQDEDSSATTAEAQRAEASPPAHWLRRVTGGPPAHWLERIRQAQPELPSPAEDSNVSYRAIGDDPRRESEGESDEPVAGQRGEPTGKALRATQRKKPLPLLPREVKATPVESPAAARTEEHLVHHAPTQTNAAEQADITPTGQQRRARGLAHKTQEPTRARPLNADDSPDDTQEGHNAMPGRGDRRRQTGNPTDPAQPDTQFARESNEDVLLASTLRGDVVHSAPPGRREAAIRIGRVPEFKPVPDVLQTATPATTAEGAALDSAAAKSPESFPARPSARRAELAAGAETQANAPATTAGMRLTAREVPAHTNESGEGQTLGAECWPELPDAQTPGQTDEWLMMLREMERVRRLEMEQRGVWSA